MKKSSTYDICRSSAIEAFEAVYPLLEECNETIAEVKVRYWGDYGYEVIVTSGRGTDRNMVGEGPFGASGLDMVGGYAEFLAGYRNVLILAHVRKWLAGLKGPLGLSITKVGPARSEKLGG